MVVLIYLFLREVAKHLQACLHSMIKIQLCWKAKDNFQELLFVPTSI